MLNAESQPWALPHFHHGLTRGVSGTWDADTRFSDRSRRASVCLGLSSVESLREPPLGLGGQHLPEKQLGHSSLGRTTGQ